MQKHLWEIEYELRQDIPSSRTMFPSRAVKMFLQEYPDVQRESALDIGSGLGRNSIYLAQQGFEKVSGIEMVGSAVQAARKSVVDLGLQDKIEFVEGNVGARLPYPDASFDLIIDMMVLHLLNADEREIYGYEVQRLLKPGGYFVFYTIAADSPAAQDLFVKYPGFEENTYIIPQSGMVEKGFTDEELQTLFGELTSVNMEHKTEFTPAFGDVYERVYISGVMMKSGDSSNK